MGGLQDTEQDMGSGGTYRHAHASQYAERT